VVRHSPRDAVQKSGPWLRIYKSGRYTPAGYLAYPGIPHTHTYRIIYLIYPNILRYRHPSSHSWAQLRLACEVGQLLSCPSTPEPGGPNGPNGFRSWADLYPLLWFGGLYSWGLKLKIQQNNTEHTEHIYRHPVAMLLRSFKFVDIFLIVPRALYHSLSQVLTHPCLLYDSISSRPFPLNAFRARGIVLQRHPV
jgi:hypothetical protein